MEPFRTNAQLLRLNQCLNPSIRDKLKVIESGLGTREATCELWQVPTVNLGDTHSVCDGVAESTRQEMRKGGYRPVGKMHTTTLDTLMENGVIDLQGARAVMKIDVEGFEPYVIGGGSKFFKATPPAAVVSEFSVGMMTGAAEGGKSSGGPLQYLETMQGHGYTVADANGTPITDFAAHVEACRLGHNALCTEDVIFTAR